MTNKKVVQLLFVLIIITNTVSSQKWIQTEKILPYAAANTERLYFGCAVSIDSNYAVIGEYGFNSNQGRASIYHFNGVKWDSIATLKASDGESGDAFGNKVSISGNTVVIGAPGDNDNGYFSGSVYIFEKPEIGWTDMIETAKLRASDGAANDMLGSSIDNFDSVVVVGAYNDDDDGTNSGSVYVFVKPVLGWVNMVETAKLKASDASDYDNFGWSVSIYDTVITVGAYANDVNGTRNGSVYIFEKPKSGWSEMSETAKLTASDQANYDSFGYAISNNDSVIVVGAYNDDDNGVNSGSAYVYIKPKSGWISMTQTAKLIASDGFEWDSFGMYVDISDDIIIINSMYKDLNEPHVPEAGAVYVFTKPKGGWVDATESQQLVASDPKIQGSYSGSISISGGYIICGASWDNESGNKNGSVYFYKLIDAIAIITQPKDTTGFCPGNKVYFHVEATNMLKYQWQISQNGYIFSNINDSGFYSNTKKDTLYVISDSLNNKNYLRCVLSNEAYSVSSEKAVLVLETEKPIIESIHNDTTIIGTDGNEIAILDFTKSIIATDNCDSNLIVLQTPNAGKVVKGLFNKVTLYVNDKSGNSSSVTFKVNVEPSYMYINKSSYSFYPNPTSGKIYLDFTDNSLKYIQLIDLSGKLLFEQSKINENKMIDLSIFDEGVYMLRFISDTSTYSALVVKK